MKKRISLIAIAFALLLALGSCSQDANTQLTDGAWVFQDMTTTSEDSTIIAFITLAKYALDASTLVFNEDKTFVIDAPRLQEAETGTWSVVAEEKLIMTYDDNSAPSTSTIDVLSKSELKYTEKMPYETPEGALEFNDLTTSWKR